MRKFIDTFKSDLKYLFELDGVAGIVRDAIIYGGGTVLVIGLLGMC